MKKFLIAAVIALLSVSTLTAGTRNIDEKMIQSFQTSFPNATEVNWSETSHAYMVTFIDDGIRGRVIYQKDGSFIHYTRYYLEQNLPFNVRYKVKSEYPDKNIHSVVEISTITAQGKTLLTEYYIKLVDDKNWTTVKLDSNGDLSVMEKYRKI